MFDRGVLVGGVRSGWFDTIASAFEEAANGFAAAQFTTEVKTDLLVGDRVGKAVTFEPAGEKVDGRSL